MCHLLWPVVFPQKFDPYGSVYSAYEYSNVYTWPVTGGQLTHTLCCKQIVYTFYSSVTDIIVLYYSV